LRSNPRASALESMALLHGLFLPSDSSSKG
jgi:hypothetical protein